MTFQLLIQSLNLILIAISAFTIFILLKNQTEKSKVPKFEVENLKTPTKSYENSSVEITSLLVPHTDPDILVSPFKGSTSSNLNFNYPKSIEPLLKMIPSLVGLAKAQGVYNVTFAPDVMKGLSEGTFSLMKSGQGLKSVAVDQAGKIVGQGNISPDQIMKSVAVVSAIWQVLAIVTAQKFLADINAKLASIEEGVKNLECWMKEQELGKVEGNLKYLNELSRNLFKDISANRTSIRENQLEIIYRESLQSIETNMLRAERNLLNLISTNFDGNLEENATKFKTSMANYFESVSYILKFRYCCAITEYMHCITNNNIGSEVTRMQTLISDSQLLIEKVQNDALKMETKISNVSGGFWDSDEEVIDVRIDLKRNIKSLLSQCSEANERILQVSNSTSNIQNFKNDIDQKGINFVIKVNYCGEFEELVEVKKAA